MNFLEMDYPSTHILQLYLITTLFLIVLSSYFVENTRITFPRITFSANADAEPEPEPDLYAEPEPEPEMMPEQDPEPEPEYTPPPKRKKKTRSTTPEPEVEPEPQVRVKAPGLTFKFDVPGLKINVPPLKLPGISIKTTLKNNPLALRLFPLNIRLPKLKLETGLGGAFGISTGGKKGFGISTVDD